MPFPPKVVRGALELAERERRALLAEMVKVSGLMPLLMKRRNKQKWSEADLSELREHIGRLTRLSPYVAVFVMPGGFAMLPALAWWLDRRRQRARPPLPPAVPPGTAAECPDRAP